jgi:hypothetical protein
MPTKKESQAAGLPPMINLGLSAEDAPHTQKCETNPISTYQVSRQPRFLRNEPNLTPRRTCGGKKNETNPIYPTPTIRRPKNAKRTQFTIPHVSCQPSRAPNMAKRTQSLQSRPRLRIYELRTMEHPPRRTNYEPKMQNKPNLDTAAIPTPQMRKTNPVPGPTPWRLPTDTS